MDIVVGPTIAYSRPGTKGVLHSTSIEKAAKKIYEQQR